MSEKPRDDKDNEKFVKVLRRCAPVLNSDCIEWTGNYFIRKKDKAKTYPYIYHKNKVWRGNRLILWLVTGKLPSDKYALHTCDNMKCLQPSHLYWGTPKQNVKDAYDRKRARNAKVTHCPKGHEYSGENLVVDKYKKRYCKECKRRHNKARYAHGA